MSSHNKFAPSWIKGHDNHLPVLCDENILFSCGNYLKLIEPSGTSKISNPEKNDPMLIAGHPSKDLYAIYQEGEPEGSVTVQRLKEHQILYEFLECEKLIHIEFISSSVLLTLSRKSLKLWDFKEKRFLARETLEFFENFSVVPNQFDGKKFIVKLGDEVLAYSISICGGFCELSKSLITTSTGCACPSSSSTFLQNRMISFFENPSNDFFPPNCLLNLPQEQFDKYIKNKNKGSLPVLDSFCWLNSSHVLVSISPGHFYKFNVDSSSVTTELAMNQEHDLIISMVCEGGDIFCLTKDFTFMVLREDGNELAVKLWKKVEVDQTLHYEAKILADKPNQRILLFFGKSIILSVDVATSGITEIINEESNITHFSTFYKNSDFLAIIQSPGRISFWNIPDDTLMARIQLPFQITAVQGLSLSPVIFFGDQEGVLHVYDMTSPEELRLIQRMKLFAGSVDILETNESVVVAASKKAGRIYFISGEPSTNFDVVDTVLVNPGRIDSVSLTANSCVVTAVKEKSTEIFEFWLENSKIGREKSHTVEEVISRTFQVNGDSFLAVSSSGALVEWGPGGGGRREGVVNLAVSRDGNKLVFVDSHGVVQISDINVRNVKSVFSLPKHQILAGFEFSFSGKFVIMTTSAGSVFCISTKAGNDNFLNRVNSESWQKSRIVREIPAFREMALDFRVEDLDFDVPACLEGLTWRENFEIMQNMKENLKYAEQKKALRSKLREIVESINKIKKENEQKCEIERLELPHLVVDTEREERLYSECDILINDMKEEIGRENMRKTQEIEAIKKEYCDKYKVGAQSIQSFRGSLEVSNYPLLQGPEELVIERVERREKTAEIELEMLGEEAGRNGRLHTQFYPQSREYRLDQVKISENEILRRKNEFNRSFGECLMGKRQALVQLNQKSQNKMKIVKELGKVENFETFYKLSPAENPREIFQVPEDEVLTKLKIYSPPSKECDQGRSDGDNWRERGLKLMMDGVLEVKKEFFKKEPEMPEFMREKDQTKWTVEEIQQAEDYNFKMSQSREEYEQYRKILENEVKKLEAAVEEAMTGFDEKLQGLFKERISCQQSIIQEELTIARMRRLVLVEEELDFWEAEARARLGDGLGALEEKGGLRERVRAIVDRAHEEYEVGMATDKLLEKSFRTRFDHSAVEKLSKIFKRRPKFKNVETREDVASSYIHIQQTLAELDSQLPEDMDSAVWDKFCIFRRQKLESEYKLKKKYLSVTEVVNFQAKISKEIDDLQKWTIPEIHKTFTTIGEKRNDLYYNLEIQFEVKQGQVEIAAENGIRDYSDAVLLHRSIVENLNNDIKKLANAKVNIMKDGRDVMNSIAQLEWDHKKMQMQYEDIVHRMREIKNFKVSRDMHKVITNSFTNVNSLEEINAFEQAIVKQQQHGAKVMKEKEMSYNNVKKERRRLVGDNDGLMEKMFEVDVEVSERRLNYGMTEHENENAERDARYRDIVRRRRMVDKINENVNQISTLRAEVERLRMAMYPSLA